jgi:ribosomal protein S18 acetylase RimI-like enzyme
MDTKLITIRQARESDRHYVINTWLRSYREHSTWKLLYYMPEKEYNIRYRRIILSILQSPNVTLSILTPSDDDSLILGYAVYEPTTLHYIHVRKEFQKLGLAKLLISHLFDGRNMRYSHQTKPFQARFNLVNWDFTPWLILGLEAPQPKELNEQGKD